jgi:hypothetical protein
VIAKNLLNDFAIANLLSIRSINGFQLTFNIDVCGFGLFIKHARSTTYRCSTDSNTNILVCCVILVLETYKSDPSLNCSSILISVGDSRRNLNTWFDTDTRP